MLRPQFPPHFLVMASALAVGGAMEEVTGLRLRAIVSSHAQEHGGVAQARERSVNARDVTVRRHQVAQRRAGGGAQGQRHPDRDRATALAVLGIGINVNGTLDGNPE